MINATEAKLLEFSSGSSSQLMTPTEFENDSNLIQTGYRNASFDAATGLINVPVHSGTGTIGFGSYVPENYTGPGAIYLYAVIIKDSLGNVLVNEEFDQWTGSLPALTNGEAVTDFTGDGGRAWSVYSNATSIYEGNGAAFEHRTGDSDKGIVYPVDGSGPFSVLMSTNITLAPGVTGLTVDLRWGYTVSNGGSDARTFALGFQNEEVTTKELFAFLSEVPDTVAPTLVITTDITTLGAKDSATITFTFSEDPGVSFGWDGSRGDIVVSGGTLSALSGTGTVRTATFTAAATGTGTGSISVASGAYTDAAGNAGTVSSLNTLSLIEQGPATIFSAITFSNDTGVSATDLITSSAAQTVGATLSNPLASGEQVFGSLDGLLWTDITSKVSGTTLTWDGVTLPASGTLLLKSSNAAHIDGLVSPGVYVLDTTAPINLALSKASVVQSAGTNATVGILSATDDIGGLLRYTLVDSGDARSADNALFRLDGSTLVMRDPAATAVGAKHIVIQVTDAAGNSTIKDLTLSVINNSRPPVVDTDRDNVPARVEDAVPGLAHPDGSAAVAGDGNGDGIRDSNQANVTSIAFLKSDTAVSNPGGSAPVYVTLVADSVAGKTVAGATTALRDVKQLDAPSNLPDNLKLPLGQISFQAVVATGATKAFSLYIDGDIPVNGYWKLDKAGDWVNLASAEYGGQVVTEGGKSRLDFTLTDGGEFDDDGLANGMITDPGGIGTRSSAAADSDGDQFPDHLELAAGLQPGVKDNDVFGNNELFVKQLYRDVLFREADIDGLNYWKGLLDSGARSKEQTAAEIFQSQEFDNGVGSIVRLYAGAFGQQPDKVTLETAMDAYLAGSTVNAIAQGLVAKSGFASSWGALDNAAFIDKLYDNVLARDVDQPGLNFWSSALADGTSRAEVLLGFTNAAENKAASHDDVMLTLSYLGLLDRAPDQDGHDYWQGALDAGLQDVELIGSFFRVDEYHDRFLP